MLFSSTYAAHELPCFSMISPVSVWFCVLTYSAEIQKRQYYPFLVLNSWVILYEQSLIIALCVNKCSWILLPGLVEMWSWAVFADSCVFQFPAPSLQVYKYQKTFADASAKNKWLNIKNPVPHRSFRPCQCLLLVLPGSPMEQNFSSEGGWCPGAGLLCHPNAASVSPCTLHHLTEKNEWNCSLWICSLKNLAYLWFLITFFFTLILSIKCLHLNMTSKHL